MPLGFTEAKGNSNSQYHHQGSALGIKYDSFLTQTSSNLSNTDLINMASDGVQKLNLDDIDKQIFNEEEGISDLPPKKSKDK